MKDNGKEFEAAQTEKRVSSFLMDAATSLATTVGALIDAGATVRIHVGVAARIKARSSANRIPFVRVLRS